MDAIFASPCGVGEQPGRERGASDQDVRFLDFFPASRRGSHVVDFGVGLALLLGFATLVGFPPIPSWALLAPLSLLAIASALAVGLWLAALNVRYRDFRYAISVPRPAVVLRHAHGLGIEAIPDHLRGLIALNPMTGVVLGFRWAITGVTQPPTATVFVSAVATLIILVGGLAYFRRIERSFADVI